MANLQTEFEREIRSYSEPNSQEKYNSLSSRVFTNSA